MLHLILPAGLSARQVYYLACGELMNYTLAALRGVPPRILSS